MEDFYKLRNAPDKVIDVAALGPCVGASDHPTNQDFKNKEINTFPRPDKESTGPK